MAGVEDQPEPRPRALHDRWVPVKVRSGPASEPRSPGRPGWQRPVPRWLFPLVVFLSLAAGCSRAEVPAEALFPTASPTSLQEPTASPTVEPFPTSPPGPTPEISGYAVAWVPEGETLAVVEPAGSGAVVGELDPTTRGIELTGNTTLLGSAKWVEIRRSGGGTGWVRAWNLVEAVDPEGFCQDSRVLDLIVAFRRALERRDGAALATLVSPRHGLVIRHDWWNPEVVVPKEEVADLLEGTRAYRWGEQLGTGFPIEGAFRQVILPQLEDVLVDKAEVHCQSLRVGATTRPAQWPSEYINIPFYTLFRPPPSESNPYGWRAWALGFEYVDGQPYLVLLVQYRPEI